MKTKHTVLNEVNEIRRHLKMQPLTESELLENELSQIDLSSLNEGWWENAKYALSKLGRYKAGGKILGKSQTTSKANAEIAELLKKASHNFINGLTTSINKTNPEFPNNKSQDEFLNTVIEISLTYDSIVAATKLQPNDKNYLSVDAANELIVFLAAYVKKFLDVDLAASYSVFRENEETDEVLDEANDEEIPFEDIPGQQVNPLANANRKEKQAYIKDKFADTKGNTANTEWEKSINSNKLPTLLSLGGGVLKGLSWVFQSDWFKNLVDPETIKTIKSPEQITRLITGGKPDSQGMLHWMSKISGKEMRTGADVSNFIKQNGGIESVKNMFINNDAKDASGKILSPETQAKMLEQLVNTNPNTPVGELFSKAAKTYGSMKGGLNLFGISGQAFFLGKAIYTTYVVTKTAVRTGAYAKYGIAAKVLAPLGIALMAGALAVKLARYKGKKASRGQILNDLIKSLQKVPETKTNPSVIPQNLLAAPGTQGVATTQGGGNQGIAGAQPTGQLPAGKQQGQLGAGGKKLTQPGDIDDIMALMEFVNLNKIFEGLAENVTDDDMTGIISEAVKNVLNKGAKPVQQGGVGAKFFSEFADVIMPETIEKIRVEYKQKYGETLNRIKLADFIKSIFVTLSHMTMAEVMRFLNRFNGDKEAYRLFIRTLKDKDGDTTTNGQGGGQKSLVIGGYDLTNVSNPAREALFNKAKEILQRNNIDLSKDNIEGAIGQLIDDINASGKKKIPKAGEAAPESGEAPQGDTTPKSGSYYTQPTSTGAAPYNKSRDTDQGYNV